MELVHLSGKCRNDLLMVKNMDIRLIHSKMPSDYITSLLKSPTVQSTCLTAHSIPAVKTPRLGYTRVYYGLGEFILWIILRTRPNYASPGRIIPPVIVIVLSVIHMNYHVFPKFSQNYKLISSTRKTLIRKNNELPQRSKICTILLNSACTLFWRHFPMARNSHS